MFSLICAWINGWTNNREAGDWRRRRTHYNVIVMWMLIAKFLMNKRMGSIYPESYMPSVWHWHSSSPRSASYMRQWTGWALVQIMACSLIGAKPLSKPSWNIVNWTLRNKLQWNSNKLQNFSYMEMHLKMSSAKWRPFCPGEDELKHDYTHNYLCHELPSPSLINMTSPVLMASSNGNIFSRYRPFVRGIHRSPVNSPHKGQWRGASMFSLICA